MVRTRTTWAAVATTTPTTVTTIKSSRLTDDTHSFTIQSTQINLYALTRKLQLNTACSIRFWISKNQNLI